jgi:hypothetical protein
MARNIHEALYYERRGVIEAQHQLNALNEIVWTIQRELGKVFIKEKVWTWGLGIQFRDTTKSEFKLIKEILPELGILNKKASQYGLQLEGKINTGCVSIKNKHDDYEQEMWTEVRFKWDVPDTCTIKNVETVEKAGDEYYTGDDGKIYYRTIDREVECTQPLLDSVFKQDSPGGRSN